MHMKEPRTFWAADIDGGWVECGSEKEALSESAQYLRRPHAMRMRRLKLSELIARCAPNIGLQGDDLGEVLSDNGDPIIEWMMNREGDTLGDHISADELGAIGEVGLRAMMDEADRRGLTVDGCLVIAHKYATVADDVHE